MNIIAIETCFQKTSVCLYNGAFLEAFEEKANRHSSAIPILVEDLLKEAKIEPKNLDAIIVNHGPGTFTGIRVGISFAKGLALPWKIPIYGVSSLECFITHQHQNKVAVAVAGLKGYVYFQVFNQGVAITDVQHLTIHDIPKCEYIISVGIHLEKENKHYESFPIARQLIERFLFQKPHELEEPLYVRPVNAAIPQNMKKIL